MKESMVITEALDMLENEMKRIYEEHPEREATIIKALSSMYMIIGSIKGMQIDESTKFQGDMVINMIAETMIGLVSAYHHDADVQADPNALAEEASRLFNKIHESFNKVRASIQTEPDQAAVH